MDKQFNGWMIAGITAGFLLLFLLFGIFSYLSELKTQLAKAEEKNSQLQTQLTEKTSEITTKNQEIGNLQTQKTDLEGKNSGLESDIQKKEKELSKRLGEVKKLQGSVKTVGRCLLGTIGVIEAFKQNDGDLARNSALLIEVTCKDAGKIIGEVEKFATDSQTTQF
jgi:predicted nuclease with TOPRIM domain